MRHSRASCPRRSESAGAARPPASSPDALAAPLASCLAARGYPTPAVSYLQYIYIRLREGKPHLFYVFRWRKFKTEKGLDEWHCESYRNVRFSSWETCLGSEQETLTRVVRRTVCVCWSAPVLYFLRSVDADPDSDPGISRTSNLFVKRLVFSAQKMVICLLL